MLNRKLLEVLSHLTAAEKKRLKQFLTSPYFNNSPNAEDIIRLYDLIIRHGIVETHPALSKEAVFRIFFPDKQFRENVKGPLDALTSDLFRLVRRFLAQWEIDRDNSEIREHLAIARFYRKFAYEERFWQTIQMLRKIQDDNPLRDEQYYFNQFRIENEELSFRGLYNTFEDEMNLDAVHKNLDLYYSILKLEFTCILEYQIRFAQIERPDNASLIEDVLKLSADGNELDIPVNRIYRLLINLIQNPDTENTFENLESLLQQYELAISAERFKDLTTFYRFLWHQQYQKSGDQSSSHHIFRIHKEHLGKGYFYIDGLIPITSFRNLVIVALKLGEFKWVKNFLDNHSPERICGTRYPAEIHSLNLAEYFFYLKEYEAAEDRLVYRHFENPIFSILADVLLIKMYYETQNELLDSRMKALDQKIRRAKLSPEVKSRYYNFVKKLDKIIKYGGQVKSPKRAKLIEEIKTTSEIASREWLLEKLEGG